MTKPTDPAFATPDVWNGLGCEEYKFFLGNTGLTKREWFAGMALQGLLCGIQGSASVPTIVGDALRIADATIAELSKPVSPTPSTRARDVREDPPT